MVRLFDHDVTNTGHVFLGETLDVEADVVACAGGGHGLVVHFHGENLTGARLGGGVGGDEDGFVTGGDLALLDTASDDITDTLDLVHTVDGHAHDGGGVALGELDVVVEGIEEAVDLDLLAGHGGGLLALPPRHLVGFLEEVVTHPSRDGEDGDLLDVGLLPADLAKHVLHLVVDFLELILLVSIGVHLVDTNDQLLAAEEVDQTSVLAGLALDLALLVVTTLDGDGPASTGGDHEESDVGLGGAGDHVLDEIPEMRQRETQ